MGSLHINKNLLYALIGTLLAGAVYYYWSSTNSSDSSLLTATETTTATAGGGLVVALSNLQGVKLDGAIFSDPVFRGLSDFGAAIPTQPIGRENPFSPLSGTSNTTQGTSSASRLDVRGVISL